MAGMSSRFTRAGYSLPKFMLPLGGETVFDHAIGSFKRYFDSEAFVFVVQPDKDVVAFVAAHATELGIRDFEIFELERPTRGQAETAAIALRGRADTPVTVFNIDTFRPDFRFPDWIDDYDGYLEVFFADGENWSFVEPGEDHLVARTTEKERISDLCSNGLYHFRRASDLIEGFDDAVASNATAKGEFYIAPLYNDLIQNGARIRYVEVAADEVILCGVPAEYEALLSSYGPSSTSDPAER